MNNSFNNTCLNSVNYYLSIALASINTENMIFKGGSLGSINT